MSWRRYNGRRLPHPLPDEIGERLTAVDGRNGHTRLFIGTDSQRYGRRVVFATAVVLYSRRQTRIYYRREHVHRPMPLYERLFSEVHRSVEAARLLQPIAGLHAVPIEIHVDINTKEQFPSNQYLRSVIGYVSSMGFPYQVKPYAFASSSCADRFL